MTKRLKFASLALLGIGAAWFAPAARADEWDKQTRLTFNEPVEVPGTVLPAGTYVFKLADSSSDRHIVQIFSEDQKHLMATVMAVPNYRLEPADKTIVSFEERPSGLPEALHSWFYPGDNDGFEFVYPKPEQQYAARSEQPVMLPAAPTLPVQQTADNEADTEPPLPVVTGEEEQVVIAQAAPLGPAPIANSDALQTTFPQTLPQTAGNFAGIPLLGIMLLSGGFAAIRFASKWS